MPQSTVIHFNKERRMQLVEHAPRPLEHQHLGALNVDLDERNRSRRGSGDEIIDSDGGDGDPFGMKTDPMITRVQLVTPEANRPGFRSGGSLVQSDAILQTGFFYLCSEHLEFSRSGSTAITRPCSPTQRANFIVKKPTFAPTSTTVEPAGTNSRSRSTGPASIQVLYPE